MGIPHRVGSPGEDGKPCMKWGSPETFKNTSLRAIIPRHNSENKDITLVCRTPSPRMELLGGGRIFKS